MRNSFRLTLLTTIGLSTIAALSLIAPPAQAQIVPTAIGAPGATGTIVTPDGGQISGGQTIGANLFHSFSQFSVSPGATADFQTTAAIQNVLARVNGGNASAIDGLLKLSGSNANLYLMNPAGIIFGPNAQLNLPASFTATTATSIGFGSRTDYAATYDNFQAVGPNIYANMSGVPYTFNFPQGATGSIVNYGNLTGYIPTFGISGNGLQAGESNALAFIGNTIFSPAGIYTKGANIVAITPPEGTVAKLDLGPFRRASPPNLALGNPVSGYVEPETQQPEFRAFAVPKLADLIATSKFAFDPVTVSNGNVSYSSPNGVVTATIAPGDMVFGPLYSSSLLAQDSTVAPRGEIYLNAAGDITLYTAAADAHFTAIAGKGFTAGTGSIDSRKIEVSASNNITAGALTSRGDGKYISNVYGDFLGREYHDSGIELFAGGNIVVNSLYDAAPLGTSRTASYSGIRVMAGGTVKVTDFIPNLPYSDEIQSSLSFAGPGGLIQPISVASSNVVEILQGGTVGGRFIEGSSLERDASGHIIYRSGGAPQTISGVNPTDGKLILTDQSTGNITTPGKVTINETGNGDLSGDGTKGLIIRYDRFNGSIAALTGETAPQLALAYPALINVSTTQGTLQLANTQGALPGSYTGYSGIPDQYRNPMPIAANIRAMLPNWPAAVSEIATSVIEPAIAPVTPMTPATPNPTFTTPDEATPIATVPAEVMLNYSTTLSKSQIQGANLNPGGLLKIELDNTEEGILTQKVERSTPR
jgi:filamentous hemagglutinin family protein